MDRNPKMSLLDGTDICVNEDAEYEEFEILNKKLSLNASTWMKFYKHVETSEFKATMRNMAIKFAETFRGENVTVCPRGSFIPKFEASSPYHYFLTIVDDLELSFDQPFSVAFHEIIDYTAGEIVDSLHINFMVELLWITTEYMLAAQDPKMTIIYGILMDPDNQYDIPFDIDIICVEMPEFGCHHSKISILKYRDNNIRIIISTANLYTKDWKTRTQALWISPLLPPLPESSEYTEGESKTKFKKDFTDYLSAYKQPEVFGWDALVRRADCSAINVFFIASIPGKYEGPQMNLWGHRRLRNILAEHVVLPSDGHLWPVVAQSSAVGVFGNNYESWLLSNIVEAMSREKDKKIIFLPELKFIFPTQDNYDISYDSKDGSSPLMYNSETHLKQQWIKNHLHQWKSNKLKRTLAMPHSKCYTRISPDGTKIPWFVLTSHNLSKGAWGKIIKGGTCFSIHSYEAGVVFLPQFVINQTFFPINESSSSEAPVFMLPYDLPLIPYEPDNEPKLFTETDKEITEKLRTMSTEVKNPDEMVTDSAGREVDKEIENPDEMVTDLAGNEYKMLDISEMERN